ncbi:MAG: MerR family transcriptional regulator [Rhodocyclaceae bacterium]|nr:MerR family transcriptional regulator [Rhodocyclaceae bacterium]
MVDPKRHGDGSESGETYFTIEQLAGLCTRDREWVRARLGEGLLPTERGRGDAARFSAAGLRHARRMAALERDFDAVPELAALVADLLGELDRLRTRLRSLGLD